MATEKLKFKLELYATMWDQPPVAEIKLNSKSYFKSDITSTEQDPTVIEFEAELQEDSEYNLIIERSGKNAKTQTVLNDKGEIIKDQLLHIKRIEIDEIDIGSLVYEGVYTPKYPEPWATKQAEAGIELQESFTNVTKLGFNGEWVFRFTSPFYPWGRDGRSHRDLQKLLDSYVYMQNDGPRNMWYLESFADCVKDKNCVEIGTGLGILSSIAIGFDPKSITAYEKNTDAYKIASRCLNKKIDVKNATIENLYQKPLAPTPDIIFHEIMGDRIWDEECNLFLPYGIDNWQKPSWYVLPGEFITEIHVSKEKSQFSRETDSNRNKVDHYKYQHRRSIDPCVSVDLEWLQKLKKKIYPMFDIDDDNLELVNGRYITDLDSNVFNDSKPIAKFLVNVNEGTITKNDTETINFSDVIWKEDTAIELNFDVEKDSFVFFRFGIKHKTSIFYLDQGHWGVWQKVLKVKKNTSVKIDQKLHNGEIGVEVEGKRHIM